MKALTTIKNTGLDSYSIHDSKGELIATACKTRKTDTDHLNGKYRICIYGGVAHGKFAYAQDMQDLNDKSVEISRL
jgi:hypothetical protein